MDLDPEQKKQYEEMCRVKDLVADDFLMRPDVTGIGVGLKEIGGKLTDELAIIVSVKEKKDVPAEIAIPAQIKGFVTDVIELNPTIDPEPSPTEHDEQKGILGDPDGNKYDPLQGGISIGLIRLETTGTLGLVAQTPTIEYPYLISNFHVLCKDKSFHVGDKICQPGFLDDNDLDGNFCGRLTSWCLDGDHRGMGGVDCASAIAIYRKVSVGNIVGFGHTCGGKKPDTNDIGKQVCKRGRTTLLTEGKIKSIYYEIKIDYPFYGKITLKSQILVDPKSKEKPFSGAGDSGSVVVIKENRKVIGLHCIGDRKSGQGTANPIDAVMDALGLEIPKSENCD